MLYIQSINKSYWLGHIILNLPPLPFIILVQFIIFFCLDHGYSFLTELPVFTQPPLISFFSQKPRLTALSSFKHVKQLTLTTLCKILQYLSFALPFGIHMTRFILSFRFLLKCHPHGSIPDGTCSSTSYLFFLTLSL